MNDVVFPSRYKPAHDQLAQEKLSLTKREETPKRISRDDEICFLESLSPPRRPQVRGAETAHISNQHAKNILAIDVMHFYSIGKKNTLVLSFNVFSTKVVLEDTNFNSATGDGSAILRGHPDHAKV